MKYLYYTVLLLFSMTLSLSASKNWYEFEEGIAKAEAEKKPVVIDFYTDWCKWCKVMDEKTFSVPEVEKYLFEHYVPIRINAESQDAISYQGKEFTYATLTRYFGVNSYPSLAYLDKNGEFLTIIPGYIEKDQFLKIITYIHKELYKQDISLDDYMGSKK
ncbi:thioredoxin family protein [bacterium]|nr:thioredoxin family protein [bacterium]